MKFLVFNDPHRGFNDKTSRIWDKVFSKIDQSTFDLVVVCGDWGTAKLDHVEGAFKAFRKAFPNKPILGVLGNHDLWDKKIRDLEVKFNRINKYAQESNIHLLEKNPYEKDGVLFLGFDGWYHQDHSDTNDKNYMRHYYIGDKHFEDYLRDRADKAVEFIIDKSEEKTHKTLVAVTHFPCISEAMTGEAHWNGNPRHGEILLDHADLVLFGHTHQALDEIVESNGRKVRVLNVGSGYKQLLYKLVEV